MNRRHHDRDGLGRPIPFGWLALVASSLVLLLAYWMDQ